MHFTGFLTKPLVSYCYIIGLVFSVNVGVQYLTFKKSHITLSVYLSIDEYCTHNNKQFCGCYIKIKRNFSILKGL